MASKKVVIIGAGIGCRMLVKHLQSCRDVEITVVQPK
jgi:NADH dehydrogenase FAD-containing subunit